jgi:hypothetical protein
MHASNATAKRSLILIASAETFFIVLLQILARLGGEMRSAKVRVSDETKLQLEQLEAKKKQATVSGLKVAHHHTPHRLQRCEHKHAGGCTGYSLRITLSIVADKSSQQIVSNLQ